MRRARGHAATREDGSLSVGIEWARTLRQADPSLAREVRLRREHFAFAAELLQRLRPKAALEEPQLFVGHVDELRGAPGGDGRVQGEVVLSVLLEDAALRARAELIERPMRRRSRPTGAHVWCR